MRFWKIKRPDYNSDYRNSYINGTLEHPFGLPGVKCNVCGATWGGSRIFPFECPTSLRKKKQLKDRWPISLEEHEALQKEVTAELRKQGISVTGLCPGDDFQPCYLDVPSKPRADFLWSSLGSVVVSKKIKELFERLRLQDVAFYEVTPRKIGKREAELQAPMPSTGEPEDLINEVPLLSNTDSVGPYYEMIALKESDYPPGGTPVSICSGCGRETIDNKTRQLVMLPSMWKGAEIFFLATTLHFVITDSLKKALQEIKPTNVEFAEWETKD